MAPDRRRVDRLARQQQFVIARSQLVELGATPDWISHQVTSQRWRRLFPGVYVVHTGAPSWWTRVTAALRYAGTGAAISHSTAAAWWFDSTAARDRKAGDTVELSIPAARAVAPQPGLRVYRRRSMPTTCPGKTPATTAAETVLDLAGGMRKVDDVVGALTRATGVATPEEIRVAVGRRARLRHRALILDVLADVDEGVESPLELRFHRQVEAAHGLPTAVLQVREKLAGTWTRADCRYLEYGTRVELDGQLAHPGGRTDKDTWRDNAALLESRELTLRYRWSHVAGQPCRTAQQVATALRRGGWQGALTRCGPSCSAGRN